LNVGCIPSKVIIYPANRVKDIKEAEKLVIKEEIKDKEEKGLVELLFK